MQWLSSVLFAPYLLKSKLSIRLQIIGLAALFILLFHSIFQPFQFSQYALATKIKVSIAYTLITIIAGSINLLALPCIFPHLFNEDYWNKKKEWIWVMWNLFTVGIGFFFFKVVFDFYSLSLERVGTGILATLAVGALPVTLYVVVGHAYVLKKEMESLKEINQRLSAQHQKKIDQPIELPKKEQFISIKPMRGELEFSISLPSLLYIESVGNYINICYLQNDQPKIEKIRSTLGAVQELLAKHKEIIQAHRAFLVNLIHVKSIEGNSSAYKLTFHIADVYVPISRSKIKQVKVLLGLK